MLLEARGEKKIQNQNQKKKNKGKKNFGLGRFNSTYEDKAKSNDGFLKIRLQLTKNLSFCLIVFLNNL